MAQGLVRLITGKSKMQWRAFWVVVQSNSSGALPIVTLIAFTIFVVLKMAPPDCMETYTEYAVEKKRAAGATEEEIEKASGPASFVAVDPDGNPVLVDQHR